MTSGATRAVNSYELQPHATASSTRTNKTTAIEQTITEADDKASRTVRCVVGGRENRVTDQTY